jgi:hypothetical protein
MPIQVRTHNPTWLGEFQPAEERPKIEFLRYFCGCYIAWYCATVGEAAMHTFYKTFPFYILHCTELFESIV